MTACLYGCCHDPANEQQTALRAAPDTLVRFRLGDWPDRSWDDAQHVWRAGQQQYATTAGVSLGPDEYAWENRRRHRATLADVDPVLLTFAVADWPDAFDADDAWQRWGEARRAWLAEREWATGAELEWERRRRYLATVG